MTDLAGTQSIARTIRLLRLIAHHGRRGARLADLAAASGLAAPTVRRMLLCLVAERMAVQDPTSRRYFLGPLVAELGLSTTHHRALAAVCQPVLDAVAQETGDTVYLAVRSGHDTVCIGRAAVDGPVRITTSQVGDRFPLGVGPGGVALLAALPESAAEAAIDVVAPELPAFAGFTAADLQREVAETRRRGYAFSRERVTPGVSGIGVAVPRTAGPPLLALSLGSITARFEAGQDAALAATLQGAARVIGAMPGVAED